MCAKSNVLIVDDDEVVRLSHLRSLKSVSCAAEAVDGGNPELSRRIHVERACLWQRKHIAPAAGESIQAVAGRHPDGTVRRRANRPHAVVGEAFER